MNNWTEQHSSWNYLYAQSIDWYSYWMIWDKRYSYHTKRNTHKSHTKQNIQIEKTKNSYRKSNSKGHNQWKTKSESEESPLTLSAKSSARISQLFDQTGLSRNPRPTKAILEKGFHTIPYRLWNKSSHDSSGQSTSNFHLERMHLVRHNMTRTKDLR